MSLSQLAKSAGFKTFQEMADICNTKTESLRYTHKHNPSKFAVIVAGCIVKKRHQDFNLELINRGVLANILINKSLTDYLFKGDE